ncbi:MAG: hypothetical protein KGI33_06930 [Thaumarchaeota archaeon]|nr:hypothetical protein [Nitrososphaerota archaeon]
MSEQNNNSHQLKISKLQERLSSISSGARKDLDMMQRDRRHEAGTRDEPATRQEQRHPAPENKGEQSVEEILQEIKQQLAQKRQEAWTAAESQKESLEIGTTRQAYAQEAAVPEQRAPPQNKSWKAWVPIPGERLSHLEKKTLGRLLGKH